MGHSLLHLLRGWSKFFFPLRWATIVIRIIPQTCGGYLTHPGVIFPSSRPSVVMVQPTKNWNTNDGVMGLWFVYSN